MSQTKDCCQPSLTGTPEPSAAPQPDAQHSKSVLQIEQMDCPTEERLIRDALAQHPHISALHFNLLERQLQVHHKEGELERIILAIGALGMRAVPLSEVVETEPTPSSWRQEWRLGLAGIFAATAELLELLAGHAQILTLLTALLSVALIGWPIIKKGWIAVLHRNLNINALMSIAVTGALLIGHWPEAAMVTFLFALAERIEAHSLTRARDAVRGLVQLAPATALVQQADGHWHAQAVGEVAVGSLIRLPPGARVALDGLIVEGASAFDQASITGESLPVEKGPQEPIFAGALNTSHEVLYRSTALADDSLLAKIMHRVQEAQSSQAPTQRFVDAFARIYTPVVVGLALLVAILPPLLFAGSWWDWLYTALVLLVIACPCALVISTPVAVVSALTQAAQQGILIKGGVFLEHSQHMQYIAFDKTGTLTEGRPALMYQHFVDDHKAHLSQVMASLTQRSDHPVSRAIYQGFADHDDHTVTEFVAVLGEGVQGTVAGERYALGNVRMMQRLGLLTETHSLALTALQQRGMSVSVLANEQQIVAWFGVQDPLKLSARTAITRLHNMGIHTLMLSGDNQHTAALIGEQCGIERVHAELLPEQKLDIIRSLQQQGYKVAMVGDGINDAPALAQADISCAMGALGSDTAIETADVALMDDDLNKVPTLIALSQATAQVLKQNISVALGLKLVFLVLALTGHATMWMAVFADTGASLLVTLNSLRLLKTSR